MLVRKQTLTLIKSLCQSPRLPHHKKFNIWSQHIFPRSQTMVTLFNRSQACKWLSQRLLLNRFIERDGEMPLWILWGKSGEEVVTLMAPSLHRYLLKVTWSSAALPSASLKQSFKKDIPNSCNGLRITKKDSTLAKSRSLSNSGARRLYILIRSKRSAKQTLPQSRAMKSKKALENNLPLAKSFTNTPRGLWKSSSETIGLENFSSILRTISRLRVTQYPKKEEARVLAPRTRRI